MDKKELLSAEKEESSNSQSPRNIATEEASFYSPNDIKQGKFNIYKGKLNSLFKPRWVGIAIGGSVLIILIIVLIIFLGSLLVPGLAQNILTYEFARVERQFSQDNNEVIAENVAVDSVESVAAQNTLSNEFASLSSTDNLFTKIKNLKPNNAFANLEEKGAIQFNYAKNSKGLGYLESVTIGDTTIPIDSSTQTFYGVFHPIQNFKNNVKFAENVSNTLQDLMPDSGIGIIIRGRIEQSIMNAVDAPRFAWIVSKFQGKSQTKADIEQEAEAEQAINPNPEADVAGSIVSPESNAIEEGAAAEQAAEQAAQAGVNDIKDGTPKTIPPIINGLTQSLENSGVTDFLKTFNPAYAIFLPLCIIYDGSIQNTGDAQQTINVNSSEDQRSFFYLEAAADQQKSGNTTGLAVGALNNKLGNNIDNSIPMERANGQTVNTSSVTISPQTAGNGEFTAINAFAPSLAPLINPLATRICPAITNPAIAGGLTAAQILAWFFGEEGAQAAADAGEATADNLITKVVGNSLSILDKLGVTDGTAAARGVSLLNKLQELLPDKSEIGKIAGIVGLDVVVRLATIMKMGTLNDGFSQGSNFADQADAGANINANQDMQQQFYGAPLSPKQVAYNNTMDSQFIADQYKHQNLYQRYLSFSNPQSLIAKMGLSIYGDLNRKYFIGLISSISKILNPTVIVSTIYNIINPSAKVMADSVVSNDQSDYGIVQWGYTNYEESLINSRQNNTYQPLENDKILSQYPSQVNKIAQTYGPCYKDSMAQLLTTKPTQGPDTNDYYITRNEQGDVIGGLCTDQYLGPNDNADPNAFDPSNNTYDLVFRWRLQQAYDNTVNTLTSLAQ